MYWSNIPFMKPDFYIIATLLWTMRPSEKIEFYREGLLFMKN